MDRSTRRLSGAARRGSCPRQTPPRPGAPAPTRSRAAGPSSGANVRAVRSRRKMSSARCFAVAMSHAEGFSGTPRAFHTSSARQKASWTTSSASARLCTPKIRVSAATMRLGDRLLPAADHLARGPERLPRVFQMPLRFQLAHPGQPHLHALLRALRGSHRLALLRLPDPKQTDELAHLASPSPSARRSSLGTVPRRLGCFRVSSLTEPPPDKFRANYAGPDEATPAVLGGQARVQSGGGYSRRRRTSR